MSARRVEEREVMRDDAREPAMRDREYVRERDPAYVDRLGEQEEVMTRTSGPGSIVRSFVNMLISLVGAAILVVEAILGFRLAFKALAANGTAAFVDFIYDISDDLVSPFNGIVGNHNFGGGFLESATIIAMALFAVAALIVIALLSVLRNAPAGAACERRYRRARAHGREA